MPCRLNTLCKYEFIVLKLNREVLFQNRKELNSNLTHSSQWDAQQVKTLAAKLDNLITTPGTWMVEQNNQLHGARCPPINLKINVIFKKALSLKHMYISYFLSYHIIVFKKSFKYSHTCNKQSRDKPLKDTQFYLIYYSIKGNRTERLKKSKKNLYCNWKALYKMFLLSLSCFFFSNFR